MKKFQIAEIAGEKAHAGAKATEDVIQIASKMGFQPVYVRMKDTKEGTVHKLNRQIQFYKDWQDAYKQISDHSIVLLQHPFHYPQLTREKILLKLKNEKHVKYISVVHDVEQLRDLGKTEYHQHEFEFMLKIADVLIVHNQVMFDFFVSKGVDPDKLVILGIFDYLLDNQKDNLPTFEKSITIAGNLDAKKSEYLSHLKDVNCHFNLYGPNYCREEAENIEYGGVLASDKIPDVLNRGFGLIWDGDSIETCEGGFGNYLRYNNPHKLSLYLASGLPVFIWSQAAEASFVEENQVGVLIDSLYDLPKKLMTIDGEKYRKYSENVRSISEKLTSGLYMQRAIAISVRRLGS